MEEQNVQKDEGISLIGVFKLLISQIKLLIIAVLIGVILGSGFAVLSTWNVKYYGTSVEFYVNPEKSDSSVSGDSQYGVYGAYGRHVMDNMVKLLSSESFIEQMLLDGEKLPKDVSQWVSSEEDVKYGITDKIGKAKEKLTALATAQVALDAATETKTEHNLATTKLNTELSDRKADLQAEWSAAYVDEGVTGATGASNKFQSSVFNKSVYISIFNEGLINEDKYSELRQAYNDIYEPDTGLEARLKAMKGDELEAIEETIEAKTEEKNAAQRTANEYVEDALSAWRRSEKYREYLKIYKQSLTFSYLQEGEDFEDADNLARSFIYVNISVLNEEEFADELLEKVKKYVPIYVKDNMTVPSGYKATNCLRTTRTDDIVRTNPDYTLNQAVKYGLLAGVAALVLVCIVLILLDRSDKRLRDTEVITKLFNVPLLGVVPSFEDNKAETAKKSEHATEVK